jgi:hypothetical protein
MERSMNGGARLLPLFLGGLFLAALAAALATLTGTRAYPPRLLFLGGILCFVVFLFRGRKELIFLLVRARRVAEPGQATTWLLAAAVLFVATVVLERLLSDSTQRRGPQQPGPTRQPRLDANGELVELIDLSRCPIASVRWTADVPTHFEQDTVRMVDPDRQPDEAGP